MPDDIVIEVKDVYKEFRVYRDKGVSLKEKVLFRSRNIYDRRTVLKGISFSIRKGEAIGLIGKNGCGKSTTLKLLTRIIYPDQGSIRVNGRVSSLLELGAGFHPDMSGRDNIYMNASVFGLTRKEIDARLETIIDFSELREFIDNPVRTYSSGMYMRLAFSVAINVDADILLIDEILAVGDTNFQVKCMNRLKEIKAQGTTIVIVSHSLQQIESVCDRSIWIRDGKIEGDGPCYEVNLNYLRYMNGLKQGPEKSGNEITARAVRLRAIGLSDGEGRDASVFSSGEDIRVVACCETSGETEVNLRVRLIRRDGIVCFEADYARDQGELFHFSGVRHAAMKIREVPLCAGLFYLRVSLEDVNGGELDYAEGCPFEISEQQPGNGVSHMDHDWDDF